MGGVGGVSPSSRMFSQSYPSIYSSGAASRQGGGDKERDKGPQEAQRGGRRSGIGGVDEACEEEDEDEDEEEDEQRAFGPESAGTPPPGSGILFCGPSPHLFVLQVFSPWTRTRCPGTASPSGPTARRRAPTVSDVLSALPLAPPPCSHSAVLSGSLSEDAPPPPRGVATGQPAYASRQGNAVALARSLPVSVPAWSFRGTRPAQGDSGERVRGQG